MGKNDDQDFGAMQKEREDFEKSKFIKKCKNCKTSDMITKDGKRCIRCGAIQDE